MPTAKILPCLILIVIAHGVIAWLANQPQDVGADVPPGKLMSLSFAPYREGFSPIDRFPLPEHIDQDLGLLAGKTRAIRTYSILGGLEPTPGLARKYGVAMIQGGWLGNGPQGNRAEIEALIKSVNAHPDVVKRVIVGNEVLLRHDMDIDTLIAYIREVKRAVKQPVSYADVWSIYLKYPQLINEVDFITIHILPYWEDEPVPIEHAIEHIEKSLKQVKDKALSIGQNKPILIGESGWPGAGRQRGQAVPGIVNQARFIRGMVQLAIRENFDYNIVEAFNQPWKSRNEGVVGANWGLLSVDRKPVFPLTGPVSENPQWIAHFMLATRFSLMVIAAYYKKLYRFSLPRLLAFLILAQALGICLVTLANCLWHTSYSPWQRAYTLAMMVANALLGGLLIQRFHEILAGLPSARPLTIQLKKGYQFFTLLALYKTYSLAFNGRYLSFPVEQFTIAALGVCGIIICLWLTGERRLVDCALGFDRHLPAHRGRLLGYSMAFGSVALILGETNSFMSGHDFIVEHPGFYQGLPFALAYTFCNQQLLAWLLCLSILSMPLLANPASKKPI